METTFTWEIKVKNTPLLIKKCSHCESDRFYCSDKFRMNAQKKNIDVWLIYRCVKCDNTCNITLLSRTKPDLIDKKLFHSFSMNDREAAWQYAFSAGMASKNKLQIDYDSVEYEVISNISYSGFRRGVDSGKRLEILSRTFRKALHFRIELLQLLILSAAGKKQQEKAARQTDCPVD